MLRNSSRIAPICYIRETCFDDHKVCSAGVNAAGLMHVMILRYCLNILKLIRFYIIIRLNLAPTKFFLKLV